MDFVTVARFSNSFDMHVVKGRLEADGIPCFVRDEHTISAQPFYDIALGGIKLQVQEKDVKAAKEILKDVHYEDSGRFTASNPQKKRKADILLIIVLVVVAVLFLLIFFASNQ